MKDEDKLRAYIEKSERTGVFNWKHLQDHRLYADNEYAIESLKNGLSLKNNDFTNDSGNKNQILYHCYWYGNIGTKQAFSIKSFLCTQDLDRCKLILWLDISNGFHDYKRNPLLNAILHYIDVRPYDPLQEVKDTPWEDHKYIPDEHQDLVKRCDAFRFLILYKYGGLYFDLDVMFLKDLGELLTSEFCYAWEKQPYANSAILNLKKQSDISHYLLQKSTLTNNPSPWKIFLYADFLLKDLYVLPCAFFDPVWQGISIEKAPFNDFSGFFQKFDNRFYNRHNITSYKCFFPGCYAYHWHNQWNSAEYENSFFGIFSNEFDHMLNIH
jgi:hypothetical protein